MASSPMAHFPVTLSLCSDTWEVREKTPPQLHPEQSFVGPFIANIGFRVSFLYSTRENSAKMVATTMSSVDVSRRARALALRAWKVLRTNWHLGFTAFGGPPVHFRIVSRRNRMVGDNLLISNTSSTKSLSTSRNGSTSRCSRSSSASSSRSRAQRAPRCCTALI